MMSHVSTPVNFCPIFNPVRKAGTLTEPKAESVRLLYSLSTEFTKYASRIYDCSQILKFAPTLISWYLNTPFSVVLGIALFASGVGRYYGGRSCFSSYQQSKRSTLVIVGCFLPLLSKIPQLLN